MRILVTGSNGFIGKNLLLHFQEKGGIDVVPRENIASVTCLRC